MTTGRNGGPSSAKRRLSKEELSLWLLVTRTIKPRPGVQVPEAQSIETLQPSLAPLPAEMAPPPGESVAKPGKALSRPSPLPLAPLERRLRQRLSRGQISIDLKIDLHGMRQDEAHAALRDFLARARNGAAKVVLVVTGKGANTLRHESGHGSEGGILRRTVPHWLSAPDLRHVVLGFEEAAPCHGGSGALYVRLRSPRTTAGVRP